MEHHCNDNFPDKNGAKDKFTRTGFLKLAALASIGLLAGCAANNPEDPDSDEKATHLKSGSQASQSDSTKVDLSGNINPYGPAPAAIDAMTEQLFRDATLSGINRYPDFMSLNIRAAAAKANNVSPLKIVPVCGTTEAANIICAAFLREGGELVTTEPTWDYIDKAAHSWGASVTKAPLNSTNEIDVDSIIDSISPDTKIVYLMNPHNPTGTVIAEDKLTELIERITTVNLLRKGFIITVIDEAYGEYADEKTYPDAIKYCRLFPVVILRTSSFAYGMAGLRCGYAIARRDIASTLDGSLLYYINSALNSDSIAGITPGHKGWKHPEGNLNRLAETGFIASLEKGKSHIDGVRQQNRRIMELVCSELHEMGVSFIPSQASYLLVNTDQIDGATAASRLAGKNILVRDGNDFSERYKNFIRVSIGTDEEMKLFVSTLKEVL